MGVWTAELYADIARFVISEYEGGLQGAGSADSVAEWLYDNRVTVSMGSVRVHLSALKRAARVLFQMRSGTFKECRSAVKSCFNSKVVDEFDKNHFRLLYDLGKAIHEKTAARGGLTKSVGSQSNEDERSD